VRPVAAPARPDRRVLAAFVAITVLAGANAVCVRFTLVELPPFWSAALRFLLAGTMLLVAVPLAHRPLPRGQQLVGTVLYGSFNFGLPYLFLYWSLQYSPAGTVQVLLAVVPLMTVFLTVAHGVERFRLLGLAGSLVAAAGIVLVFRDQASLDVPVLALAAILVGAFCFAETGVLVKRVPPGDPISANAIGMLLGGGLLLAVSVLTGERQGLPLRPDTWLAIGYLVLFGSVAVFVLVLYVLERWTASAVSYGFLLAPFVTIALGAALLGEPLQPVFLLGGGLVLLGVYIGAFYGPRDVPGEEEAPATPQPGA
jgi:drug/metabolite transporter (DMT)-like permease